MKRTTVTQGVVIAIATWLLAAPASARQGETRLTDKAVVQIIESVEKGRNTFESKIDGKLKSSILRSPRGELRVDAYLDDLETNVKNLKSRFDKSYSASSEAETVLRQSSIIDGFMKTSG
jgi:gas vesicle protein